MCNGTEVLIGSLVKLQSFGSNMAKFSVIEKDIHIESRREFFDWLQENIKIPGIVSVERDTEFDNERMRSAGTGRYAGSS